MTDVFDDKTGSHEYPLGPLGSAIARDGGRPLSVDPRGLGVMVMDREKDEGQAFALNHSELSKRTLARRAGIAVLVAVAAVAIAYLMTARLQAPRSVKPSSTWKSVDMGESTAPASLQAETPIVAAPVIRNRAVVGKRAVAKQQHARNESPQVAQPRPSIRQQRQDVSPKPAANTGAVELVPVR